MELARWTPNNVQQGGFDLVPICLPSLLSYLCRSSCSHTDLPISGLYPIVRRLYPLPGILFHTPFHVCLLRSIYGSEIWSDILLYFFFKSVRKTFSRRPPSQLLFISLWLNWYACLEQWLAKGSRTTVSVLENFPGGCQWSQLPNETKGWAEEDGKLNNFRELPV